MIGFILIVMLATAAASLLGIGGGILILPILIHLQKNSYPDAVFLCLCSVFLLSVLKVMNHRDLIRPRAKAMGFWILSAGLGALAASWLVDRIPAKDLVIAFDILLIFIALKLLFFRSREETSASSLAKKTAPPLFFMSGSLAGFFGIGGGILNVPIFHRVLRIPMNESTALSFFFVFISSGVALLTQFHLHSQRIQQIPDVQLISLLVGTFLGFALAKKIRLKESVLRIAFACLLIAVALGDLSFA